MLPTLELRIPISPNDKYMRMLHYFVESLRTFGGEIGRNAHCLVVVGEDAEPWDLAEQYPWTKDYSLDFIWVPRDIFRKDMYDATGYVRLWRETNADVIGLVDADLLFAGDFDEIVLESYEKQSVLGFIAHTSPFSVKSMVDTSSEEWWCRLFKAAGLSEPTCAWQYTGWGLMASHPKHRYCPAYYNYGVILMPRALFQQMATSYVDDIAVVDTIFESKFKSQIANTLVFARYHMRCATISINYNFPLHVPEDEMRALNPDPFGRNQAEDIKIFHYLGQGEVNKQHFETEQSLQAVLQRENMSRAGTVFKQRLQAVHERLLDKYGASALTNQQQPLKTAALASEIIICGGRRTGTTLLAAILSTDGRTNPLAAEAQLVTRLVETYRWGRENFSLMLAGSFFDDEIQFKHFYQVMLQRFSTEVSKRVSPGGILILKNPEFSLVLLEMLSLFKNAVFLATIRDPRDQISSEIEVSRRRLLDKGEAPEKVERNIDKLARRYLAYLRLIIKLIEKQSDRISVVRYEDMVLDTEKTLTRLEMLTGLHLKADAWQRVSDYAALDKTASRSDLYGAPISPSSVGRYRKDLTRDEIKHIEHVCAKIMQLFGYAPDNSEH